MKRMIVAMLVSAFLVVTTLRGASHAENNRRYGVYPALVVNTSDPLSKGRLLVKIPSVSTMTEAWALPSVPYTDGSTASIKLPPVGAEVWVQFIGGDPSMPVWIGWKPR